VPKSLEELRGGARFRATWWGIVFMGASGVRGAANNTGVRQASRAQGTQLQDAEVKAGEAQSREYATESAAPK
jgi:hypothetical protein